MMTVVFIDVGRNHRNWQADTDTIDYAWLYGQIKKNGQVMSSGLDFSDDGKIYAGFRNIGRFEVVGEQ